MSDKCIFTVVPVGYVPAETFAEMFGSPKTGTC